MKKTIEQNKIEKFVQKRSPNSQMLINGAKSSIASSIIQQFQQLLSPDKKVSASSFEQIANVEKDIGR